MRRKVMVVLLGLMVFSSPVLASDEHKHGYGHDKQGKGHHGKHRKGGKFRHLQKMLKQLDLSEEQKVSLKSIFKNARQEMKPLREQMREKRKAMYALMHADPDKEAEALALANGLADLKRAKMLLYVKTHFQVSAQLSPAQRAEMRQMHDQHHKH